MAYADQQMSGNRITAFIIVAIIHIALVYALVTGLAYEAAKKVVQKVTTIDIEEEVKKEEPPPPPPKKLDVPPPPVKVVVPPPKIDIRPVEVPKIEVQPTPTPTPTPVFTPKPQPQFTPKGPTPKNQRSWAARIQENYPSRAIREQREGRVGVRVQISADGRVTSCSVTSSSGSSDLDSAACEGMQRYARYNPATDGDGKEVSGTASTTIVYRLQ